MMKKLTNKLEVNEKDNFFTAFAKGGVKGMVTGALVNGAIVGTIGLIGLAMRKKEENSEVEEVLDVLDEVVGE